MDTSKMPDAPRIVLAELENPTVTGKADLEWESIV